MRIFSLWLFPFSMTFTFIGNVGYAPLLYPTLYTKVRERDFVCFVFFVGKLGFTKNLLLFLSRFFYSKNDRQHLIYLFYKYEVHLFPGIFRHFN